MMDVAVVLCSKVYPVSLSVTLMIYAVKIPLSRRVGRPSHSRLMLEWLIASPLTLVGATLGATN